MITVQLALNLFLTSFNDDRLFSKSRLGLLGVARREDITRRTSGFKCSDKCDTDQWIRMSDMPKLVRVETGSSEGGRFFLLALKKLWWIQVEDEWDWVKEKIWTRSNLLLLLLLALIAQVLLQKSLCSISLMMKLEIKCWVSCPGCHIPKLQVRFWFK